MEETVDAAKAAFGIKDTPAPQASAKRELSTEVRGVGAELSAWQISIPRAILVASGSALADNNPGVIFPGEIRSSLDQELLGNATKPLELVMFGHRWEWKVSQIDPRGKEKPKFVRLEPLNADTFNAEKEFEENGNRMKRTWVDRYYGVDVNPLAVLPYEVVMQGMSYMTAKNLNTKFFALDQAGKSSLDVVVGLTSTTSVYEGKTHQCFAFTFVRSSTPEEKSLATKWAQSLQSGVAKARSDVDDDASSSAAFEG